MSIMAAVILMVIVTFPSVVCEVGTNCLGNVCHGKEGEVITVPCNPKQLENEEGRFTYYNQTSKSVLLRNTTDYLQLNLTAYDDDSEISCVENSITSGLQFYYTLSVQYSPGMFGKFKGPVAYPNQPLSVHCPLTSNPPPTCSWHVDFCFGAVNASSDLAISFDRQTDGCVLFIEKVTLEIRTLCYTCTATNELGSTNFYFNAFTLNLCPEKKTFVLLPQPEVGSSILYVKEGQNITFSCQVYGIRKIVSVTWGFNSTLGNMSYFFGTNEEYTFELCRKTSFLIKESITENDSGVYTCYADSPTDFQQVKVLVISEQDSGNKNDASQSWTIGVVCSCLAIFLLLVTTGIVYLVIKLQRSSYVTVSYNFLKTAAEETDENFNFDVFISFAEEDKAEAEKIIKIPLEILGYNVCWHHDAFIPGHTVNENMEYCIFQSRYTVALISRAFFKSNFCQTELEITRRKIQGSSHNSLIPVLIENWENIPPEFLKITYVNIENSCLVPRLQQILGTPLSHKDTRDQPMEEKEIKLLTDHV